MRSAIAFGLDHSVAEQYAKVFEDFLRKRDEVENPVILGRFGSCVLRKIDEQTGRGLALATYAKLGDVLWNQRPLVYIQSPCSAACVQVCGSCLEPVGSLASQLAHLGLSGDTPAAAEAMCLPKGGAPVPCGAAGCAAVFCDEECRTWALEELPHAMLCAARLGERAGALRKLETLAMEDDQENLLLLAHHVAQMTLRVRRGDALEEVMRRYVRQFASRPWEELADEDGDVKDTPAARRELFVQAQSLLQEIFAGEEDAMPFLEPELLSGLLGTYELVNMCVSLVHPLNARGSDICELLSRPALARVAELQRAVDEDSDSDGDEEGEAAPEEDEQDAAVEEAEVAQEASAASARRGALFANVVGTSLCEALSFTNHCCLPNCCIDFATPGGTDANFARGPGLWAYARARRPLMPGDEVQIAYVPSVVGRPLEVRQRRMQKFGFPCRCRSCLTDEMLLADDAVDEAARKAAAASAAAASEKAAASAAATLRATSC